jgi:hypothetical protein
MPPIKTLHAVGSSHGVQNYQLTQEVTQHRGFLNFRVLLYPPLHLPCQIIGEEREQL